MKRPLVVSAIALIWGIVIADGNISFRWGLLFTAMGILALLLLYRPIRAKASRFVLLAIPFLLLGFFLHSQNKAYHNRVLQAWESEKVTVSGNVSDAPSFAEGKTRFTLAVDSIDGRRITSGFSRPYIQVSLYSDNPVPELRYGSAVRISGELRLPEGKRNIGGFDTKKYLAAKEISGILSVPASSLTMLEGSCTNRLKAAGYRLRRFILQALDQSLPERESSVMAGMLIGYTEDMPAEMEEAFRRAGLSHVMAVSGANIVFLLLPLLWLLQRVGFNRRWSSLLAFPMMIFYVFATGMEASVVRAAVMAGVTLAGMLFWRRTDLYCSLAASAILILTVNSYMLFDMGFILSFTATLSLAMFSRPLSGRLPVWIPKGIRETLAATISAQLGVIPVIATSFNTLSTVSVLSNLLIVPMTGLITVLGALIAISGGLFPPLGAWIGFPAKILIDAMLFITEGVSKISWAEIGIATPSLILAGIYYLLLLYFRYGHPRLPKDIARNVLAGILLLCGTIVIFLCIPSRSLRIYFADVGQGDCILIRTPENRNIIIDGGGSIYDENGSYAGENIVVPLLYDLNMTRIDLMIATHGHADHINGLKSVIDKVGVKELVIADAPDTEMQELTDYAGQKGIPLIRVKEGTLLFEEEDLTIHALYPLENMMDEALSLVTSANELSLVTRLDYGSFAALFTGDIGADTEEKILEDGAFLPCDLLKIAHHGSKYSSGKSFLQAVSPRLAVVSVGRNRYGHPSPETLKRIREQGILAYQTLENGGVLVEVRKDDSQMHVSAVIP